MGSTTSGRLKSYGGGGTSSPDGEVHEIHAEWLDATFALRNIAVGEDGTYELAVVMIADQELIGNVPMEWNLSATEFSLTVEAGSGSPTVFPLTLID